MRSWVQRCECIYIMYLVMKRWGGGGGGYWNLKCSLYLYAEKGMRFPLIYLNVIINISSKKYILLAYTLQISSC